ncbi:MAG: BspA family leucine-rich repeat surface protein [Succinivibrio sp.]
MLFRKKHCPKSKLELRKLILNEEIELSDIDTSRITDMSHLFEPTLRGGDQARFFFDGIETWDVSHVTDMSYMFCYAKNFNQDINSWNVSSVRNMRGMFQFASSFNQPLDKWDVSGVENMSSMFYDAAAFNQDLDRWDIHNVKTMRFMFMYARYFDHKPSWDMSRVEDEVGMYYGTPLVYVDPDLACSVDESIEKLAAKESLEHQFESNLKDDAIAQFVRDLRKEDKEQK